MAVKVIPNLKFKKNGKLRELMGNEMKILTGLDHESIIRFIELVVGEKEIYMVYEYCEGGTLEERMTLK